MYSCQLCTFSSESLKAYTEHYQFHKNVANFNFPCGVSNCTRTFNKYSSFRSHVHRDHQKYKREVKAAKFKNYDATLSCQVPACTFKCKDLSKFFQHLRSHIDTDTEVQCPFKNCIRVFSKKSSFSSHLSKKHRDWAVNLLSNSVHYTDQATFRQDDVANATESVSDVESEGCIDDETCLIQEVDHSQYLHSLSLFYLKLQAKFLLPSSTIQSIIDEYQSIHDIGQSHLFGRLHRSLTSLNVCDVDIKYLIDELSKEDLLRVCNTSVLRSDQTRKTFFKSHYCFVEPVQVHLGQDPNGRDRFFQYIPVKETIQALFKHCSVRNQYHQTHSFPPKADLFEDISDGKTFLSNKLYQEFPTSLRLILYQDAFEVVNPLGSGRKKHKVIAVYLTLADLLPHNRSNIDHVQLVLLCREQDFKNFGQIAVFSRLVHDLSELEKEGIDIEGNTSVKGTVCAIAGDNLGSHCIGGFSENFSTTEHFCRYCRVDRKTFKESPHSKGPPRTVQSYTEGLQALAENPKGPAFGVKSDSIFNSLQYFHVCQPGLPPCLGHDLFEGVVSADVALCIKHFVEADKSFTYVQLNRIVDQFKYLGSDTENKPCEVNVNGGKLGGHAVQNWCFLRLLPLFIGDRIKDPLDNQVWQLCLNLRKIVELICAPKIHIGQVAELKVLLEEYLEARSFLFKDVPLKPKHHYLMHYPDLILKLGPLIRLWTLRFEAKHTYFKQCARKLHNFKNLCSTLAERHQLLQAYYSAGFLFPSVIQVANSIDFSVADYNSNIQQAVRNLDFNVQDTVTASSVTYKGTTYKRGLLVVLDNNDEGLVFGKIVLILIHGGSTVYFITEIQQSVYLVELGLHCLVGDDLDCRSCVCVQADHLLDYYPCPVYKSRGLSLVALHHAVLLQD